MQPLAHCSTSTRVLQPLDPRPHYICTPGVPQPSLIAIYNASIAPEFGTATVEFTPAGSAYGPLLHRQKRDETLVSEYGPEHPAVVRSCAITNKLSQQIERLPLQERLALQAEGCEAAMFRTPRLTGGG